MDKIFASFTLGGAFAVISALAVFFFQLNQGIRIRKMLSAVLFVNILLLLKDILLFVLPEDGTDTLSQTLIILNNLIIGVNFLYVYELLKTGVVSTRTVVLSTGMFLIFPVIFLIFGGVVIYAIAQIFSVIYLIVALLHIIYYGRKYEFFVKRNYSDPDRMEVAWLWSSVVIFSVLFLFSRVVYLVESYYYNAFYYFLTAGVWIFVSYRTWGYKQLLHEDMEEPGENMQQESVVEIKTSETGGDHDAKIKEPRNDYHFTEELNKMREGDFFCRHPKISLVELAEMLKTNRTTLSSYINGVLKITFYDLTNDARIRHAISFLERENFSLKQEELAAECGFNSLSTFRRVFIDKVGCSPKEYLSMRNTK